MSCINYDRYYWLKSSGVSVSYQQMGGDGCVEEIQLCRCEPVAWVTVWWVCSLHGGLDPRPRINFTRKTVRLAGSLMNSAQGWSYISVPLCTTHVYTCCHFIVAAAATHTQCCQLISKSSFSRQCVGRIRDTCSQLTWNLHTHTHTPYTWRHFST